MHQLHQERQSPKGRLIPKPVPLQKTHFLNVDLEIASRSDLTRLIGHFGDKVDTLYAAGRGRMSIVYLELAMPPRTPDFAILRFCTLIQSLPRSARRLWTEASKRDFNIGVQVMDLPNSYAFALKSKTVKAAAAVGARIVFTTYSPKLPALSSALKNQNTAASGRRTSVRATL